MIHIAFPPQNNSFINTSCLRWVISATGNGHIPTLYPCASIDDNGVQFISVNNTKKSSLKRWDQSEVCYNFKIFCFSLFNQQTV